MSEQDAQDTTRPRAELRRWPVRIREARLIRRATVTPRMLRLTFGGPAMTGFESHIADEHVKLLFPEPFDDTSRIPVPDGDRLRWPRPIVPSRDYTVRRHDPATGEVDIDVVAHEGGVASTWAREAAIGSTIWMAGPPRGVHVPDAFQWQALLGDETALPAIARRLAELPRDIRGVVVIEVADAAEEQPMDMPEGFEVRWLHRDGRPAGTTTLLADAAADIAIPAGGGGVRVVRRGAGDDPAAARLGAAGRTRARRVRPDRLLATRRARQPAECRRRGARRRARAAPDGLSRRGIGGGVGQRPALCADLRQLRLEVATRSCCRAAPAPASRRVPSRSRSPGGRCPSSAGHEFVRALGADPVPWWARCDVLGSHKQAPVPVPSHPDAASPGSPLLGPGRPGRATAHVRKSASATTNDRTSHPGHPGAPSAHIGQGDR